MRRSMPLRFLLGPLVLAALLGSYVAVNKMWTLERQQAMLEQRLDQQLQQQSEARPAPPLPVQQQSQAQQQQPLPLQQAVGELAAVPRPSELICKEGKLHYKSSGSKYKGNTSEFTKPAQWGGWFSTETDDKLLMKFTCRVSDLTFCNHWNTQNQDKVTANMRFLSMWANCRLFQPMMMMTWPPMLAVLGIGVWHIRFHFFDKLVLQDICGFKPEHCRAARTWRKILLNVLILYIYFYRTEPTEPAYFRKPFVYSIELILLDTVGLFYGIKNLKACLIWFFPDWRPSVPHTDWGNFPESEINPPTDEPMDDGYFPNKDCATSKYEDVEIRLRKVIPVFVVQLGLLWFYTENLNTGGDDGNLIDARADLRNVEPIRWLISVMLQLFGGEAALGEPFSHDYWRKVCGPLPRFQECIKWCEGSGDEVVEEQGCPQVYDRFKPQKAETVNIFYCIPVKFGVELWIRRGMDFAINGVLRSLVMYTFPIMLCVEEPLDFVKDATAVLFISTLDDLDEPVPLEKLEIKMKFRWFWEQSQEKPELPQGEWWELKDNLALDKIWTEAMVTYYSNNEGEFSNYAEHAMTKEAWKSFYEGYKKMKGPSES